MSITIQLAVDSIWGTNTPKRFFERYPQFLTHLNEEDHDIISNPEHEHYWEVWDQFVSNFTVMKDGDRWFLSLDEGDVFFVSEHHQFND
jgi:hypothetical protein